MRKLIEQPFWLDTSDPHQIRSAIQICLTQTHLSPSVRGCPGPRTAVGPKSGKGRLGLSAVQRVVTDGISLEQAVDEAIVRIKQILSE